MKWCKDTLHCVHSLPTSDILQYLLLCCLSCIDAQYQHELSQVSVKSA